MSTHHWLPNYPMGNLIIEIQIQIMPMGLVMEEAAMVIILIATVTEPLTILMVVLLEVAKITKTKVIIMNIKMELINRALAVFLVMYLSSKINNTKHNNIMEMLVKNTDKIRYNVHYSDL